MRGFFVAFLSVSQTEMPKWNDYSVTKFNVILYDNTIRNVLDLFLSFLSSTNFKSVITNDKVRLPRSKHLVLHTHLIVEKRLTQVAHFGFTIG